ncbi:MAG: hypothetical protein KIS73_24795 [Enhydrobacter sp.]|nr:hypothetical protein [Enhydrobacter sp.]
MPSYSVSTTISAVDKATEVVRGISASFTRLMAPIKAINQAVAEPKTTALGKVGAAVDGVAGKFRAGLGSITSWIPALGALGSIASLGGLISMTRQAAESYEGITLMAERLGSSVKDLAVWRLAAKDLQIEVGTMEKGFLKLNRTMYDAATGKNKDVALLFQRMGISLRGRDGQVKKVGNSLEDIAESFRRTRNESARAAMATALFGKAGADLLPFLIRGREGINEWRRVQQLNSGMTEEHNRSLGDLSDAYDQLDAASSGLTKRLSASFAPTLAKLVNRTTGWIRANRELIAQSLERKIEGITRAASFVAKMLGSVVAVPIVGEWLKAADVSTAFDIALGTLGLTLAGPVFAAVQTLTAAMIKLNIAMWANPWVLVLGSIATAAFAVYANWGPITSWFDEQMSSVSAAFDRGLASGLVQLWNSFNPVELIMKAVSGLSEWLFEVDLYDAGARLMQRLMDGIRSLLPDFNKIWAPIERGMNWVGRSVSSAVSAVTPDFDNSFAANAMAGTHYRFAYQQPGVGAPAAPQRVTGEIDINITGAPQGTTAEVRSDGAVKLNSNVGWSMLPPGLGRSY